MSRQQQQSGIVPWTNFFSQTPRTNLFPSVWEDIFDRLGTFESESGAGLTVYEDKQNVYAEAALPGLKPEDIEVTLEKGILWIRGEKKEEEENKDKKFYRKATSSFSYRLALPGQIDETQEPKATYQDGIMKIIFNKAKQNQTKKITVKGSS